VAMRLGAVVVGVVAGNVAVVGGPGRT